MRLIELNLTCIDHKDNLKEESSVCASKRTKHINVRHFFISDRIHKKEVRVEYCPTGEMVADFFTKPLQGAQFRLLRDYILNIPHKDGPASIQSQDHRSVLNEIEQDPVTSGSTVRKNESAGKSWAAIVAS